MSLSLASKVIEFSVQSHWVWHPNAMGLRSKVIEFENPPQKLERRMGEMRRIGRVS